MVWVFALVVLVYLVLLLLTTPVLLGTRFDENTRAWIVTLTRQSDGLCNILDRILQLSKGPQVIKPVGRITSRLLASG